MSVPEHLWRFPTAAAIDALARRFGLPNGPEMQDWEWEVADPERIDEFLAAYDGELTDDERFTLMEILLQSFEERAREHGFDERWSRVLRALEENLELHAYSLWYWSSFPDPSHPSDRSEAVDSVDPDDNDDHWLVTPDLRKIVERHRDRLEASSEPGLDRC